MVSQLKVNEIIKQSGSSVTIGEAGDTITLPSTSTLTNFPENTPVFQAMLTSDQTLSSGSFTKIQFNKQKQMLKEWAKKILGSKYLNKILINFE